MWRLFRIGRGDRGNPGGGGSPLPVSPAAAIEQAERDRNAAPVTAASTLTAEQHLTDIDRLLALGDLGAAEAAINRALASDQGGPALPERRARLAERQQRWPEALAAWADAAAAQPDWALPRVRRAELFRILNDLPASEAELALLSPSQTDAPDVQACLGGIATHRRDWDRALEIWQRLRAADPDGMEPNFRIIEILVGQQRLLEASEALRLLPPALASHPRARELCAHVITMRGDFDCCFDVLRPLAFIQPVSEWTMHQTVWILVELRRFAALRAFRAELEAARCLTPEFAAKFDRAETQADAFAAASRAVQERWPPAGMTVRDMVASIPASFGAADALRDAAEWWLYTHYPADFDVLMMMADPKLVLLCQHRASYFRRLLLQRYPGSEAALQQHLFNLYSAKQYAEVMFATEAFGLPRIGSPAIVQTYLTARDIVAPGAPFDPPPEAPLPAGFRDLLAERAANARALATRSNRRKAACITRPRIALCISGQLRGYKSCFGSLQSLIIDRYETQLYVRTWARVGNAVGTHGARLQRMLPPELAAEIPSQWTDEDFFARFPSSRGVLLADATVSHDELAAFMHPANCVIENETAFEAAAAHLPRADNLMNAYKMYYQMAGCLTMAGLADPARWDAYDLVIWIRPDIRLPRLRIESLLQECIDLDFVLTSFLPPLNVGDFTLIGSPANMSTLATLWDEILRGGERDPRFAQQGLGPPYLCNHLFRTGRRVKHTDMFVAADAGPHGARPDAMRLLDAMTRDLRGKPRRLPLEQRALERLAELCRSESNSAAHERAVADMLATVDA
jgi:tetratricopeptide (TPR) repeat protein